MQQLIDQFYLRLNAYNFASNDNEIQWEGEIQIDWISPETNERELTSQRVAIYLPNGFPYEAPFVVSKDSPPLTKSYHLAAGKYPILCLWDSATAWNPNTSADELLDRIRAWYQCYHTENWPLNSYLPDLQNYLSNIAIVLIGNEWNLSGRGSNKDNSAAISGEFTLWMNKNKFESSITIASTENSKEPETRLKYAVGNVLDQRGIWYRLPCPIVPDKSLSILFEEIDIAIDEPKGTAIKMARRIIHGRTKGNGFPIAIAYPDYSGQERYLFMWAQFPEKAKRANKFNPLTDKNIGTITMRSMKVAPASSTDLLKRTSFVSRHLTDKTIVVFGIGAVGSSVSLLLAKSGIGRIKLVDSDVVMPGNAIRHIAGIRSAGVSKTLIMYVEILNHNPDCVVNMYEETWKSEELQNLIQDTALVIDTTGNINFSQYLNHICLQNEVAFLHGAAYRRAQIGRFMIHRSLNDPCLSCYVQHLKEWDEDQYPLIRHNSTESFMEDGCGSVTEEAVAIDVEAVANTIARTAVQIVRSEFGTDNIGILVNSRLADLSNPLLTNIGVHWWRNEPRIADCINCSSHYRHE